MTAQPKRVPADGDRPSIPISTTEPDYFGRIPKRAWADPDLSIRAKVVLGALAILAGPSTEFHALDRQIMAALGGQSLWFVQRGLRELVKRGYLDRSRKGTRFKLNLTLKGAKLAVVSPPEDGGEEPQPPPQKPRKSPSTIGARRQIELVRGAKSNWCEAPNRGAGPFKEERAPDPDQIPQTKRENPTLPTKPPRGSTPRIPSHVNGQPLSGALDRLMARLPNLIPEAGHGAPTRAAREEQARPADGC